MQRLFITLAAGLLGFLTIAPDLHGQNVAESLKNAKAWADKREYDKAIAECDKALALDPKSAEAYNTRGWVWADKGEHDKALADFNQALALDPKLDKAYCNRADAWTSKGQYAKAIADCNEAIRLNPKNAIAYCARGIAYEFKGEYDKTIADCTEAVRLDSKYARAYCERGYAYASKGENEQSIADFERALAIKPDNWNLLNNFGVCLWKLAQQQDFKAAKAEAAGDMEAAKAYREKCAALKDQAKAQWNRGIAVCPTATDIHSNLGYAYAEANDLESSEHHLREAVRLKPRSPRPRNNLGRVLLRRSQLCEAEAREAEAKGKTDPAQAAKAKQFVAEAKTKRDLAIEQFEEAVRLDPTLLEARLNLGEVYMWLNDRDRAGNNLDKAEKDLDKSRDEYRAILELHSLSVTDRETLNNFSQASFGLARIAIVRKNSDEAIRYLQQALELNPQNVAALQLLARVRFERGEYREGEKCLWRLLAVLPRVQRRNLAQQFGGQFEAAGKHKEAAEAWGFMAWVFATGPEPNILDPETALKIATKVVEMTKQPDLAKQRPMALDALAAAQAAAGQYDQAAKTARTAIDLANSQGNKPLAEAISRRLQFYQQAKPYRCDPDGGDRP
jgi:tetratricopeptide (TPR) repeat protein